MLFAYGMNHFICIRAKPVEHVGNILEQIELIFLIVESFILCIIPNIKKTVKVASKSKINYFDDVGINSLNLASRRL